MTQDNKCDITGGYYSVIHICERCGCKYARHVGNNKLCKSCIVETEERINRNFSYKIIVPALLFVLMLLFSVSVLGASYNWVRPPSNIVFFGDNDTIVSNDTYTTSINISISGLNLSLYAGRNDGVVLFSSAMIPNMTDNITASVNESIYRKGDIANDNKTFIWRNGNMSMVNLESYNLHVVRDNTSSPNMSDLTKAIYPKSSSCYNLGYYSPVGGSGTTQTNHLFSAVWSDDVFTMRGSTSVWDYRCINNDTYSIKTSYVVENYLASRDNTIQGYTYAPQKQTLFYQNSVKTTNYTITHVTQPSETIDRWRYNVSFTRSYSNRLINLGLPKIVSSCYCNGTLNDIWDDRGGMVSSYIRNLTYYGFEGTCKADRGFDGAIWASMCGGSAIPPIFTWYAIEEEDDRTANYSLYVSGMPIVDGKKEYLYT